MARLSKTGSKASKAKARKASQTKGRKVAKSKRRAAPAAKPRKRTSVSELEAQLQHRTIELNEAREQQAATAEIIRVINGSPGNLAPVFDIILEKAHSLCDVSTGSLELYEGDIARSVATRGMNERWEQYLRQGYRITEVLRPAYQTLRLGHVVDMRKLVERFPDEPAYRGFVEIGGLRTFLALPLVKDGIVFGRIVAARAEVRPFTDQQISLLQSFADQAVIAIENARILTEQCELLEQQTATAEILKVINSSPGDLAPVFDIILEKAHSLCDVTIGSLEIHEGQFVRTVAMRGFNEQWGQWLGRGYRLIREELSDLEARRHVHIIDMRKIVERFPNYTNGRAFVEIGGLRTFLGLTLAKDGKAFGRIIAARDEVRPFTDKQITLLQSFADQAVIAIENARLLTEQREALERQTATADILNVISSSVADTAPVFEQILDSCERLAAFNRMAIFLLGEDGQVHIGAYRGGEGEGDALKTTFPQPLASTPMSLAFERQQTLFFGDVLNNPDTPESLRIAASRMGSFSVLVAPLLWEGRGIGAFHVARNADATFSDREVALLKTFADQAAIAIQNARLFKETREALEQQKASADILAVISSSVADAQPVFDKILVSCKHLFGGDELDVLLVDEQGQLNIAAYIGDSHDVVAATFPAPVERTPAGRAIRERRVMHWPDLVDGEDVPGVLRKMAKLIGYRSMVFAPMLWEGRGIGAIGVARSTGAFKPKELAMIQTFADQAVIAIQNARLFNETREALEQQKASAEVLSVISNSVSDTAPVFERILDSCERLFATDQVAICLVHDDAMIHARAVRGSAIRIMMSVLPQPVDQTATGRSFREQRVIHIPDAAALPDLPQTIRDAVGRIGNYSCVFAPMLWHQRGIGSICVMRQPPSPFTVKEIALLTTFADQAVIAIQNARLFDEVQERTRELSASLDELRTTQDRLIQTEKLASLGQLTAGIAHEIKNPLNFVNNFSALSAELTDELNDVLKPVALGGEIREAVDELTGLLKDNLEKVVQHGRRADSIVKNMLLQSREGSGEHRSANINALVEESLNLAYHGARAEKPTFNITLKRDLDPDAGVVDLYPQEISRALLNLIANGFYAATQRKLEEGQTFEPILIAATKNLGKTVEIRIRDNGTGIPPEVKDKMFNPFFTTKPAGEGTGLGLSMSHDIIVKQHGGSIDVETELGQFTQFTIVLPRTGNLKSKKRGQP